MSAFFTFLSALLALMLPMLATAAPKIPPAALTNVCSAIVYDLENEAILFEQNADQRIPPASLTKVLSMFLALDHIATGNASLSDNITISPLSASQGGSRMGLRAAETVPFQRLLLGMAVSSGNDASHAVAEHVGGSEAAFVKMMNARAAALGMADSFFANPHGLPHPAQFTTARDMLTLARAYLKSHPRALDFHNTLILEHAGNRTWNRNPLIGQYAGADGLKTGWIRASGYNMIFTAEREGRRLLAVILGAPDAFYRGAEACRLLDAGFLVCGNQAPTMAAALDSLPLDLNRIDPRKTAKDAGIPPKRAVAVKKALPPRDRLLARKKIYLAQKNGSRILAAKNTKVVQGQKPQARHKAHAEGRTARPKRS